MVILNRLFENLSRYAISTFEMFEFLCIIQAKLTEKAWLIMQPTEIDTYQQYKDELVKNFGCIKNFSQLEADLISLKQGPKENVQDFAIKIKTVLGDLNREALKDNLGQSLPNTSNVGRLILSRNEIRAREAFV